MKPESIEDVDVFRAWLGRSSERASPREPGCPACAVARPTRKNSPPSSMIANCNACYLMLAWQGYAFRASTAGRD